ncbi:hypothetical protein PR202_ga12190 [Eleusine coracana subsp. coracana]|uniref:BPM/SPOP BACK domain-containing protein n=1 Tax=Eleusine coracana subsp. coracana TaxID=191504 RepID=A0AAV5CB59_ELECO|nr:hypothetical protein PR202_ga12190 [Eleusine coracana subsp. coracana]
MLCERIDMTSVVESLAVAKDHGCQTLEAMCLDFIARPWNLKAVMKTEGFEKIKTRCPGLLLEPLMNKFAN